MLVVEDSEDNQTLIRSYLGTAGISVDIANNGEEGMQKAMQNNYDLVLMDIQMPGIDGHQATKQLRNRGYERPIIALTAHAFKEDRDRAFEAGCDEYLTKPINRGLLLQVLEQKMAKPRLH